jgi:phosphate acetyltransferase
MNTLSPTVAGLLARVGAAAPSAPDSHQSSSARIVYPEGANERVLQAARRVKDEGIGEPILIGDPEAIAQAADSVGVSLDRMVITGAHDAARLDLFAKSYATTTGAKLGIAQRLVKRPLAFGGMMVRLGLAEGMVAGVASPTASVIKAAAMTIGFQKGISTPSSFFLMILPEFMGERDKVFVFADAAVQVQPNAQQLAEIAVASGRNARDLLGLDPRIAFLSFSTKGSAVHADADKVIRALELAREIDDSLVFDGELQADSALIPHVAAKKVSGSPVAGQANVLVFPDLNSGNIAYKLVQYLAGAQAIGPILQGFAKPVNDLSRGASIADIVNVTGITVAQGHI